MISIKANKTACSRRPFTLLEIMVVLTLLSLCLGALGVRSAAAIRESRLDSAGRQVATAIALAQRARSAMDCDVELHIRLIKGRLYCSISSGEQPSPQLSRLLRPGRPIEGVHALQWEGEPYDSLTLSYPCSTGGLGPRGVLALKGRDETWRYIRLKGYDSSSSLSKSPQDSPPLEEPAYPGG